MTSVVDQPGEKPTEIDDDSKKQDTPPDDSKQTLTLLEERQPRKNRKEVNYKEEREEEEQEDAAAEQQQQQEEEEEAESEDYNPLYHGLNKEEIAKLKETQVSMQGGYEKTVRKERLLKIEEIKNGFLLNIEAKVNDEEACFVFEFCKKHQFDPLTKIEDEGIFFLESMREMIEERKKLAQIAKNKKRQDGDDSDSEFQIDDDNYSEDSDFSFDAEDDQSLLEAGESSDEDWEECSSRKKGKRRKYNPGHKALGRVNNRSKKPQTGYNLDGSVRCGRLLLNDAMARLQEHKNNTKEVDEKELFAGWSIARIQSYKNREDKPNAYYYRFNDIGENQKNGQLTDAEKKQFMKRVKEFGVNSEWGIFSKSIPGRVGYQCSNYWRQLVKDGDVIDPNYCITVADGKKNLTFRRGSQFADPIRRFSFTVVRDGTGVFKPGETHRKRPQEKELKSVFGGLEVASAAKKEKEEETGKEEKNNNNNNKKEKSRKRKKMMDEEEEDDNNNRRKDKEEEEKKKKKKKRRKKKKKSKGNEDDDDDFKGNNGDGEVLNDDEDEDGEILPDFIDVMTGCKIVKPAISPYGHLLGYESWCKILRREKNKDVCPFTKQKLTRRSLVKLDASNVEEYRSKIVNIDQEMLDGVL